METTYNEVGNKADKLKDQIAEKDAEINTLKEKLATAANGSSGDEEPKDAGLTDVQKYLAKRKRERATYLILRSKIPRASSTTTNRGKVPSYYIPNPKKFNGTKPSEYKNQKTRI